MKGMVRSVEHALLTKQSAGQCIGNDRIDRMALGSASHEQSRLAASSSPPAQSFWRTAPFKGTSVSRRISAFGMQNITRLLEFPQRFVRSSVQLHVSKQSGLLKQGCFRLRSGLEQKQQTLRAGLIPALTRPWMGGDRRSALKQKVLRRCSNGTGTVPVSRAHACAVLRSGLF